MKRNVSLILTTESKGKDDEVIIRYPMNMHVARPISVKMAGQIVHDYSHLSFL